MENFPLIGLASIIVIGVGAQWLSWRLKLPAILLLLVAGFLAGPVTGIVRPDELFGESLFHIVSLSVGIILFEGGLSLRLSELTESFRPVRNLMIVGSTVTWLGSALAAYWLFDISFQMALLLGAILVVTGPTVIIPILRQVRPKGMVGPVLKWEGILIDPLGAVLALLVFETIVPTRAGAALSVGQAILQTIVYGGLTGVFGALVLIQMLRRYWIPDYLQNSVAIMMVIAVFTTSNLLQHESGLLAVTVMGIILANQQSTDIRHIVEFKESLRVLLIAVLFILLAARLDVDDFVSLPAASLVFLGILILAVRPLAVALSTFRTKLTLNEKAYLAWLAPRGIVAASVSSLFALRLAERGYAEGEILAPLTFLVIVGTVTLYGLTAMPVAKLLNVAQENPAGILFVGAHRWARAMAKELREEGFRVMLADTNWAYISAARMDDLPTYFGNVLADHALDEMNLTGIGKLMALTPNDQVNSLAAVHYTDVFDRKNVYQLPAEEDQIGARSLVSDRLRGRDLFDKNLSYRKISQMFMDGAQLKKTPLTEEFTYKDFREHYGENAYPLMLIDPEDGPMIVTAVDPPKPRAGQLLLSLVPPDKTAGNS